MNFDYFTLYTVIGALECIVAFLLIYYIVKVRSANSTIYLFLVYKLLDAVALTGFGFLNSTHRFISLEFAVVLLYLAWWFFSISMVSYRGKVLKKQSIILAVAVLIAVVVYLATAGVVRECVTAVLSTLLFTTVGIDLIRRRKPYTFPLLIGVCSLIFALANIIRTISYLQIGPSFVMLEVYTTETIHILISLGLILITTIGYFLLLSELDKEIIFEKSRLNRIAMEQSPMEIVITDLHGKITWVNATFCRMTGYAAHEVLGENPRLLQSGLTAPDIYSGLWKTILSGNTWFGEFVNKKKDGTIYFEEAAIAPLKDKRGVINSFIALKSDITDRKVAEELILKQNRELTELNETKNRLFSIISHDLRNPIGNMMSFLELTREFIQDGEQEKVVELLAVAENSSKASYELLENLLNWARSQLSSVAFQPVDFDLHQVIREISDLYQSALTQKEITLLREIPEGTWVHADLDMIRTVLRNLTSNAIKFTPEQGHIAIQSVEEEEEVRVLIRDTGVGIETARLEKLFSFTSNKSTYGTSGEKGTGLGLVLTHEFLAKHGSRLTVESQPGAGSCFSFQLKKAIR
ncbi:MAG: ATP-binding protein [Marinilabiliales bacterium]|nr:ATP-binding protein [Marinilabiliales bacterium]